MTHAMGLEVTPIPKGVMQQRMDIFTIRLEWKVVVVLEMPEAAVADIQGEIDALRYFINNIGRNKSRFIRLKFWNNELNRLEHQLNTSAPRPKRGILDIVGQISKSLFGTATNADVSEVRNKINENRDSLNAVIHHQNDMLTIINITRQEVEDSRSALNQLINGTNELRQWATSAMSTLSSDITGLMYYNLISEKVELVERHLDLLDMIKSTYQGHRRFLERGFLDEALLSRQVMREVANLHRLPGAKLINPIEWYYTNVHISPLWRGESLAYQVHLPLVDPIPHLGYIVRSFPVPIVNTSNAAKLLTDGVIAVDTWTGGSFTVSNCMGHKPLVCPPLPRSSDVNKNDCIHAVVLGGDIKQSCTASISHHTMSIIYSHPGVHNQVVLSTWGEEIIERCPSKLEQRQILDAGVFDISWDGTCILYTKHWSIPGVVTKYIKKVITEGNWVSVNVSQFVLEPFRTIISKSNVHIPDQLGHLSKIPLADLHMTPMPDIVWSNQNEFHYLWLLFIIVFIIAGILIYLFVCRKRRNLPPGTSTSNQEGPPVFKFQPMYPKLPETVVPTTEVDESTV